MSVKVKPYHGEPGLNYIIDPALSNVKILRVSRNGTVHHLTNEEVPGGLQFVYSIAGGAIVFDPTNPFYGPEFDRPNRFNLERIEVKYKA